MIPSAADLAYFMEIAHTANISRAAERLSISQPSLSMSIRRLEKSVGTTLLIRGKRGVTLTPAGKQLLAHARQLLESWDTVRVQALASSSEIRGVYTIGCHPSVGLHGLSGFLPGLMTQYPDLEIRLRHDLSRHIAEDVVSMKADLGIVVNPVRHPDLVIHRLCGDTVTLWTSVKSNQETQNPKNGKAVLICDPDLVQSQRIIKQVEKMKWRFARTLTSNNLDIIADLTAQGCGIGILPGQVAKRARKKLTPLPKAPEYQDDHCLIFRMENKSVQSIQTIGQTIRDFYARTA